jgi:hypothetical protein
MTEAEWLAGDDLAALTRWVEARATPRQRALIDVAQARRLGPLITPDLARVLDARDRLADGQATEADLRPFLHVLDEAAARARRTLDRADQEYAEAVRSRPGGDADEGSYPTVWLITGAEILRAQQAQQQGMAGAAAVEAVRVSAFGTEDERGPLSRLFDLADDIGRQQATASACAELAPNWEYRAEELAEQLGRYPRRKRQIAAAADEWADRGGHILEGMVNKRVHDAAARTRRGFVRTLHDIVDNPFRPVAFDPRWKTADVIGLARGIYDERAFERMPLLADALMDAGCADERVIAHCREPGAHYRGCWVLDAVLALEPSATAREAATR